MCRKLLGGKNKSVCLTLKVLAVGEGEEGGESDRDFLVRDSSLVRGYRDDMALFLPRGATVQSAQALGCGREASHDIAPPHSSSSSFVVGSTVDR